MSTARTCLKCGAPLPADASEGFCTQCLFLEAGVGLLEAEHARRSTDDSDRTDRRGATASQIQNPKSKIENDFGDYELLDEIGRGGMGIVYRARQKSLDRVVAIKMVAFGPEASPGLIKRFHAEAVSAAALQHPNVVAVHEMGVHRGQHFFVMDYVEGQNLAQLAAQPLGAHRAARYLQIVAETIQYAHARGILHRDLKPSNILIDSQDEPRVVDFGLARRMDESPLSTFHSQLTLTGQMLGSPNYLPPEQAAGKPGAVSRRTDIYALGATLYHLLTGRPPFQAESLAQTLDLVLHQEPVSPRLLQPSLPRDLETICLKCLEKDPIRRYGTAKELADDLGRFLSGEPIRARPIGATGKGWRWCRRNPLSAGLAGIAGLFLLLGFVGVLGMWRQAERHRQSAQGIAYVRTINAADAELKANNPARALELLRENRPVHLFDRRTQNTRLQDACWEWRYLWQEARTATAADALFFGRMEDRIRSMEVSPDGHWLLATSESSGVKVWDLQTREEIPLVTEAPLGAGVKAFGTFSPESCVVAFTDQSYATGAGRVGFWDTRTRQRLAPITDPWIIGGSMAFSPDGKFFGYAGCGPDCSVQVKMVDFLTREQVNRFDKRTRIGTPGGETGGLVELGMEACLSPDGRTVIFTENYPDPEVVLWDYLNNRTNRFRVGGEAVITLAVSPDGHTLATAGGYSETAVKLWRIPESQLLGPLTGHRAWVACVRFSPDGKLLASAGTDGAVRLWDLASTHCQRTFGPLPQPVHRVCFTPDGQQLFAGTADGIIYHWPIRSPPPQQLPRTVPAESGALAAAPDGNLFASIRGPNQSWSAPSGGTVFLGHPNGAGPLIPIPELGTNNTALLFSSDGQSLFAGSEDGDVRIWSLAGRQLTLLPHVTNAPVLALVQDRQARTLAVLQEKPGIWTGQHCRVGVFNLSDQRERTSFSFSGVTPVCALSPNGRWLAVGQSEGPVQVWDLTQSPRPRPRSLSLTGRITGVAFSSDCRMLAACTLDGKVGTWRTPTFAEVKAFQAHPGHVIALSGVAFSPDSRRLATAGENVVTIWAIWNVDTWQKLITLQRPGEVLFQLAFSGDGNQLSVRNSRGDALFWPVPSWRELRDQAIP